MFEIRVDVDTHGPIFDGRADKAIEDFLDEAKMDLAHQGLADLHLYMDAFFKNPTPYYETQVLAERQGNDAVIHDRGIIYGPWLAGQGSRNFPVTRFKGYTHWRRTLQDMRKKAPALLERTLQPYLRRMQ